MNCDRRVVNRYLNGKLDEDELFDFMEHIDGCKDCYRLIYLARRSETNRYRGRKKFKAPDLKPEKTEEVKVSEKKAIWEQVASAFISLVESGLYRSFDSKSDFYREIGKTVGGRSVGNIASAVSTIRRKKKVEGFDEAWKKFIEHFGEGHQALPKRKPKAQVKKTEQKAKPQERPDEPPRELLVAELWRLWRNENTGEPDEDEHFYFQGNVISGDQGWLINGTYFFDGDTWIPGHEWAEKVWRELNPDKEKPDTGEWICSSDGIQYKFNGFGWSRVPKRKPKAPPRPTDPDPGWPESENRDKRAEKLKPPPPQPYQLKPEPICTACGEALFGGHEDSQRGKLEVQTYETTPGFKRVEAIYQNGEKIWPSSSVIHLRLFGLWRFGRPFDGVVNDPQQVHRSLPFWLRWLFSTEVEVRES